MTAPTTDVDRYLAKMVVFKIGENDGAYPIEFQFPPKITNDSRSGTWDEYEVIGSQPIAYWKSSGARKWVLEWTYIVGACGWNVLKVKEQVANLRKYWDLRSNQNYIGNLLVTFRMWKFGGAQPMTCRLTNIDVSYGKAIYVPRVEYNIDGTYIEQPDATTDLSDTDTYFAYPVVTNIKVSMQLWTKGGYDRGTVTGAAGKAASAEKAAQAARETYKVDVKAMEAFTPADWQ